MQPNRVRRRLVRAIPKSGPQMRLRQGVVQVVGGDGTVDLTLSGSTVTVTGVARLAGPALAVSDTVIVLSTGYDLLILGKVATS